MGKRERKIDAAATVADWAVRRVPDAVEADLHSALMRLPLRTVEQLAEAARTERWVEQPCDPPALPTP